MRAAFASFILQNAPHSRSLETKPDWESSWARTGGIGRCGTANSSVALSPGWSRTADSGSAAGMPFSLATQYTRSAP